jgi:hypothetical protein
MLLMWVKRTLCKYLLPLFLIFNSILCYYSLLIFLLCFNSHSSIPFYFPSMLLFIFGINSLVFFRFFSLSYVCWCFRMFCSIKDALLDVQRRCVSWHCKFDHFTLLFMILFCLVVDVNVGVVLCCFLVFCYIKGVLLDITCLICNSTPYIVLSNLCYLLFVFCYLLIISSI